MKMKIIGVRFVALVEFSVLVIYDTFKITFGVLCSWAFF